jgi:hypothetical protein
MVRAGTVDAKAGARGVSKTAVNQNVEPAPAVLW